MRHQRAFTFLELCFVVAIIAVLAAIAVPNFLEAQIRSKIARTRSDMSVVAEALSHYAVDNFAYPPNVVMLPASGMDISLVSDDELTSMVESFRLEEDEISLYYVDRAIWWRDRPTSPPLYSGDDYYYYESYYSDGEEYTSPTLPFKTALKEVEKDEGTKVKRERLIRSLMAGSVSNRTALNVLTTPVRYLWNLPIDTFSRNRDVTFSYVNFTEWAPQGYSHPAFGGSIRFLLVSPGPDNELNGAYPLDMDILFYDPSNGSCSDGDLFCTDHGPR